MHSHELTTGRTFGARFDPGESFFPELDDPEAPVWSKVHLTNAEAFGCGTIAYDEEAERIVPHIHTQPPATPATSSPLACSSWSR